MIDRSLNWTGETANNSLPKLAISNLPVISARYYCYHMTKEQVKDLLPLFFKPAYRQQARGYKLLPLLSTHELIAAEDRSH